MPGANEFARIHNQRKVSIAQQQGMGILYFSTLVLPSQLSHLMHWRRTQSMVTTAALWVRIDPFLRHPGSLQSTVLVLERAWIGSKRKRKHELNRQLTYQARDRITTGAMEILQNASVRHSFTEQLLSYGSCANNPKITGILDATKITIAVRRGLLSASQPCLGALVTPNAHKRPH